MKQKVLCQKENEKARKRLHTTGGLAQAGAWLVRHLSVEQPLPLSSLPLRYPRLSPSRWDVTQSVIERVEAEVHSENRARIFERVQQRLKDEESNHFSVSDISKAEAVEKAKLIQKWIDGIGDIKEEDEELSAIWEGWFIEMNKDPKTTDQKRVLEIMKTLSAEEAKLMLEIKERGYIKFSLLSKPLSSRKHYHSQNEKTQYKEKIQYLVSQLLKRELIVKTSMINIMTITIALGILLYGGVGLSFLGSEIQELFSHKFTLPITIVSVLFILTFFSLWLFQKRYKLTWIGEKIVSYAKKNTERRRNHDNNASR